MSTIVLDCTELYANPVRTGIQRVVRELIRCWPDKAAEAIVSRFVPGVGLVRIPAHSIRLLSEVEEGAESLSHTEVLRELSRTESEPQDQIGLTAATVFIPEVFYDPTRCLYYEGLLKLGSVPIAMLAYDFLPYLRPELFNVRTVAPLMHYLRLIRSADHVGYISFQTRTDYLERIMRGKSRRSGPVLPLGSDGLSIERQTWTPLRRDFVALGSIDGRKNQHLVVRAFIQLWRAGINAPLTLIGRAFEGSSLDWLTEAKKYSAFRWLDVATDLEVADVLRVARATIYVSEAEGFGLPPVESLAAGIPAVTSAKIPSVATLSTDGQIRLNEVTERTIADAIIRLVDDDQARKLWEGAASLRLTTWQDFGAETAAWLNGIK